MKLLYPLLTLFSFSLSITLASAQEDLSLSDAIEKGLTNNYQVQISRSNLEIAQNNNTMVNAGRYPTIDLSINSNNGYTFTDNPASILINQSSFNAGITPGIAANWILFDGYRVKFSKRQLEEFERQSEGEIKIAIENTIQNVILAYQQALIQKEQLGVLEDVLELSRDRVEYQEVRKEFGQAVTFDVLQTQDAYLNDSTNYLIQQTTYTNALRNLNLAMGEDDMSKQYELTDKLELEAQEYELEAMREKMIGANQSLQNLFINRELAQINTRLQETQKYPRLSLSTGATYNINIASGTQTFRSFGTPDPNEPQGPREAPIPEVAAKTFNYFFNLSATYTLFDWGLRKTNIQNAKVQELTAQFQIEDFKRNLNNQLENTWATYNNQKQLVTITNDLLENAKRNLDIAEERFKGGLINSFDYRTIQISYINASQSRLNAIFNLKNTETELIRLIGGLIR